MIRAIGRSLGVWLLLLGGMPSASALDPHRALDHFGHQAWRTDSGLPQNTVHSLLQARDGYLWLATDGGLVRFDGMDFLTFDAENTPQFRSDTVYDLCEDSAGTLWIATAGGLLAYREGHFSAYGTAQGLPADTVWLTHEDRHHRLWAMTSAGPAWLEGKRFVSVPGTQSAAPLRRQALEEDADGTLWLGGSGGLFALDTAAPTPQLTTHLLDGIAIEAIAFDRSNPGDLQAKKTSPQAKRTLWIGTAEGLARYAGGKLERVRLPGRTEVTALSADAQGGMWAGTTRGLLHAAAGAPFRAQGLGAERVDSLFRDREGVLWIAAERGLLRLDHEHLRENRPGTQDDLSLEAFAPGSPLAVNRALTLYEDREGDLWVGTDSAGLHLLREQKFTTYSTTDGLTGNFVRSVFESANGELWVGTDGEGLNRRTPTGFAHVSLPLASNVILSLADGPGGALWVGTANGLNHLPAGGLGKGRVETFTSADGLPDDFIRSLYTDRDGSLWVGTRHGLAHLTEGRFTSFSSMDGLGSDLIGALLRPGPAGSPLWIGTSAGLSRFADGRFRNDTVAQGLSNNTVTAITEGQDGTLWLGTNGGGLNRLYQGSLRAFPWGSRGLPGTIYGILEDSRGKLWLSSKTGIFAVAVADLNAYASGKSSVIHVQSYGTADGMNIRECSGDGHPSAWKTADGTLWFATLDGVSAINPEHMPENRVPPPVVIEKVLVDDQERSPHGEFGIRPGANRLEFHYAGLSFVAPEKVQYRYRLEGFDPDWVEAGNRRAAFYTNLAPGHYRFHVMAANNDGVWNTEGASVGLRMLPHVYQTWWFYSALVLSLGALGYLVYRWRVLEVEAQWTAVLRERSRIAREIHDTLAQGFVGISVQLELVARLLKSAQVPASVLEQLDQVRALVRSSLADARTSIWDLRSASAGAEDLPSRMSRASTRIAGGSNTRVYLQVKGTYRAVARKIEDELLRIGQEAVTNAVRHAAAGRIDVDLVYEAARVSLCVVDDGCGFSAAAQGVEGHYGLRGMRERAREIDGAFVLESSPGAGTRIRVDVPLDQAAIRREPRRRDPGEREPGEQDALARASTEGNQAR
jgi:ligand-binding sensor domain-containing protein/signal transduction histidine kinase